MIAWTEHSREEAHLFNPSFLGLLSWSVAAGYREASGDALPLELPFLALPLTLHKPTREALPASLRTSLAAWIETNAERRVGFIERARGLTPFVRNGILFATTRKLIVFSGGGRLLASSRPRALTKYLKDSTAEVRDCMKGAEFLGRWFAAAGAPTTVMALWGVAP